MRQPTAPTADYHGGHSKGIFDIVSNTHDNRFILSVGRDNQISVWNINTQKVISQREINEPILQALWLRKSPDSYICVTTSGNLIHHQVAFAHDETNGSEQAELPPKWLMKRGGCNFSFGGKFATFSEVNINYECFTNINLLRNLQTFLLFTKLKVIKN